jgi:hypothetical protein
MKDFYDSRSRREALRIAPLFDASGFRQLQYERAMRLKLSTMELQVNWRAVVRLAQDGLKRVAPDEAYSSMR